MIKLNHKVSILSLLLIGISLAACSQNVKRHLGLEKKTPDEFNVITLPALVVPESFELQDPRTRKKRDATYSAKRGKSILIGDDSASVNRESLSPGERFLLKKTGADNVDPSIRERIALDNEKQENRVSELGRKLGLGSMGKKDESLDPDKEQKRLRTLSSNPQ